MTFDKYIHLRNQHSNLDIEQFHHPQENSLILPSSNLQSPKGNHCFDFYRLGLFNLYSLY